MAGGYNVLIVEGIEGAIGGVGIVFDPPESTYPGAYQINISGNPTIAPASGDRGIDVAVPVGAVPGGLNVAATVTSQDADGVRIVSGGGTPSHEAQFVNVGGSGSIHTSGGTGNNALTVMNAGGDGLSQHDGQPGGDAAAVTVTALGDWTLGTDSTDGWGLYLSSVGGDSGHGGNESGVGGVAGAAGAGGAVTIGGGGTMTVTASGDGGGGLSALSQGGTGGDGGKGGGDHGGNGGAGGDAGIVTLLGTWVVTTTGSDAIGVSLSSEAGAGGAGGQGDGTVGGVAAPGGTAGAIKVGETGSSIAITTAGDGATGLSVTTTGGNGGSGSIANEDHGGYAEAGGDGGAVTLAGQGIVATSGSSATAVSILSQGGDGGTGGEGPRGGNGASAGAGGAITVSDNWVVTTGGSQSGALELQSLGGAGGNGGKGTDHVAGFGGDGGTGGVIIVGDDGSSIAITTTDDQAAGLFVSSEGSVGGTGGEGGGDHGGNGGNGGAGGGLTFAGTWSIATQGDDSPGLSALSQGGDGGNGGNAENSYTDNINGGNGGTGGDSGAISLSGDWTVETQGDRSYGIALSSAGGYGGDAGSGSSGLLPGVGGTGGTAGTDDGLTVDISSGTITTHGTESHGIAAQSVGGRGGSGGSASGILAFGASGGSGGGGGSVQISNSAAVTTGGSQSSAIVAQSIGGGGGHGGKGFGLFYSDAGSGSIGGVGGAVTVDNWGKLSTDGADASGIFTQSIGGTGGDGGSSGGALLVLGGHASEGSDGGSVVVNNFADIVTGQNIADDGGVDPTCGVGCSYGVLAQSIGGGGGNGGSSVGWFSIGAGGGGGGGGGSVVINNEPAGDDGTASVTTHLWSSAALIAQSIGGGGGSGGSAISAGFSGNVSIGGTGGSGGSAGQATIYTNDTDLTTWGDESHAVFAQSVGGGGGHGGFAAGLAVGEDTSLGASIGGEGGSGGAGGTAIVTTYDPTKERSPGTIATHGDRSYGVLAQSVGGGGGNGGFAVEVSAAADGPALSLAMGGTGGSGGDGGTATVETDGTVTTMGDQSVAVSAQSIGGGGGNGGFSISGSVSLGEGVALGVSLGGSGGSGGDGGVVDLTSSSVVATSGHLAHGLLAQSVGGGGGNGGFSLSGDLSFDQGSAAALSLGGSGGSGGDGDQVAVTSGGSIATTGDQAYGLLAQSVGGGGGNGGFSLSASGSKDSNSISASVSIGGTGGSGGDGAAVTVDNAADITTSGKLASALLAQSLGGGGGNGGMSVAPIYQSSQTKLQVALGGTGGEGGAGGDVMVTNSGTLRTGVAALSDDDSDDDGDDSSAMEHALFAQSVGGGGGTGGIATLKIKTPADGFPAIPSTEDPGKGSIKLSLGVAEAGEGGAGGAGGTVTVINTGYLSTGNDGSYGLFAQSLGGGGGAGGMEVSAATFLSEVPSDLDSSLLEDAGGTGTGGGADDGPGNAYSGSLSILVGGAGGDGNVGGPVTVTNSGMVTTSGDRSYGIFAHSVGGSGGDGGSSNVATTELPYVGLTAADSAFLAADDPTGGDSDDGSSDGGGSGGDDPPPKVGSLSIQANLALGGVGGSGNKGGTVDLANSATVATTGFASYALKAQSVGGGGGTGGAVKTNAAALGDSTVNVAFGIGGAGGTGGDGGDVTVTSGGVLSTLGVGATALVAQSVGGGGGDGGDSQAGDIPLSATFHTVTVEVGGTGGASGDGGSVTVAHQTATITTAGTAAGAILAQSVGGGGGSGGTATAGTTGYAKAGGAGWASGDGGEVSVAVTGAKLATGVSPGDPGDTAYGILAQSVGGGGGIAGGLDLAPADDQWSNYAIGLNMRRTSGNPSGDDDSDDDSGSTDDSSTDGSSSGDGGDVTVDLTDVQLTTSGDSAAGLIVQSVGGGGGIAGSVDGSTPASIGNAGGGGQGGDISVILTSGTTIATSGAYAHGIMAQSVGGTAAGDGARTGTGGSVTLNIGGVNQQGVSSSAQVLASGIDANGILAHSEGAVGNGTIDITLADGSLVQGGTGRGVGILVLYGSDNVITNNGTITSVAGAAGTAIRALYGTVQVYNAGIITGSQYGLSGLTNEPNGTIRAGSTIDLGGVGILRNFGVLVSGAPGEIAAVTVDGNLVQPAGGIIEVEIDASNGSFSPTATSVPEQATLSLAAAPSATADTIHVTGTADLDGRIETNVIHLGKGGLGRQSTVVVTADGGVTDATFDRLSVPTSAVAAYGLERPSGTEVALSYEIDFAHDEVMANLNGNQRAVAGALAELHDAAIIDDEMVYLLDAEEADDYGRALDRLNAQPYAISQWATVLTSQRFNEALLNCGSAGDYRLTGDDGCLRLGLQGSRFQRNKSSQQEGYAIDLGEISLGAERSFGDGWSGGFSLAYNYWRAKDDDHSWSSSAKQVQVGGAVGYDFGAARLSLAVNGGYAHADVRRDTKPGASVDGTQDIAFAGGRLQVDRQFDLGGWYLRPNSGLDLIYVHSGEVKEHGEPTSLRVESDHQLFASLRPGVEIGTTITTESGLSIRPRAGVGLTHFLNDPSPDVEASFRYASGAGSFDTRSKVQRTALDLNLGLDVLSAGGARLGLSAFSQMGDDQSQVGGTVRLSIPF